MDRKTRSMLRVLVLFVVLNIAISLLAFLSSTDWPISLVGSPAAAPGRI